MSRNGILNYLCCAACAIAIAPLSTAIRASAQTPTTDLSFEVAAIKPVDPSYRFDGKRFWAHVTPAGASYWYMSPVNLIEHAYDIRSFQVAGPEWANASHFDIEARFPEGADKKDEPRMLQTLLKDRFKLIFHTEQRELEGYVLVVGKHGEKLKPSLPDPATPETATPPKPGDSTVGEGPAKSKMTKNPDGSNTFDMGKRGTETMKFDQENWITHYERSKMTLEELAARLSGCLGSGVHHVEDQTGIKGNYQVAWDCPLPAPQRPTGSDAAASDPQDSSSLTQSLDALGLKLEKRKTLQDVYVIDHLERPSEN